MSNRQTYTQETHVVTALCNQPEAFASDLGDDQSPYLFSKLTDKMTKTIVMTQRLSLKRMILCVCGTDSSQNNMSPLTLICLPAKQNLYCSIWHSVIVQKKFSFLSTAIYTSRLYYPVWITIKHCPSAQLGYQRYDV